jgi:oxygen-dependent protoporphyrinogen oxidase
VALTPNIFKLKKSGLLKFKDIFRIFLEIFIKKPDSINLNETLYSFFERRFGKKFANTFLVSLSFGIWGGGSRKLLLRYTFPKLQTLEYGYGSLIKMGLLHLCKNLFLKKKKSSPKGLASFANGMEFLVNTLFNELKKECLKNNIELVLNLNSNVNLIKRESNFISVNFLKENNLYQEQYHSVLYSGQPWRDQNISIQSMELEKEELEKSFHKLKNIESHSIAIIGLGSSNIPENTTSIKGFGALAGEWSKDILGTIFVHSTYPSHAPTNSNLFRVLLGGDRNPLINQKSNE